MFRTMIVVFGVSQSDHKLKGGFISYVEILRQNISNGMTSEAMYLAQSRHADQ